MRKVPHDIQRQTHLRLKNLNLEKFISNDAEPFTAKVEVSSMSSSSTVPVLGKTIIIGGEKRQIIGVSHALVSLTHRMQKGLTWEKR